MSQVTKQPARQYAKLGRAWLSRPSGSEIFYINWRDDPKANSPSRESTRTRDEAAANQALAKWVLDHDGPQVAALADSKVAPLMQWYYDSHVANISSAESGKYNCAMVIDHFGHMYVGELRKAAPVEAYIEKMRAEGYADGTINRHLMCLRAALNRAFDKERLTERPPIIRAIPVEDFVDEEQEAEIFTEEELADLFQRAKEVKYLHRLTLIMAATMCRPGAARDLAPQQIDFKNGLIHLNPPGRQQQKNKYRPVVRHTDCMRPVFEQWMRDTPATMTFVNIRGERVGSGRTSWDRIVKRDMGLQGRYVFYSVRHTIATLLNASGVDEGQIAVQLGHKRMDVGQHTGKYIRKKFVHIRPEYLRETGAAINAIMARALAPRLPKNVIPITGRQAG